MSARIGYIDIAKGFAIAFIVIGHVGLVFSSKTVPGGMPPLLLQFAFSFHLFVFFIASGYFMKTDTPLTGSYLKKTARSLLIPYVVTCLLVIAGCTLKGVLSESISGAAEFIRWTEASLWGAGGTTPLALWNVERIGGIWFLLALFWAKLFIAATSKLKDSTRMLLMVFALGMAVVSATYVWLPLSIQSGLGCAMFVYLGALIKKHRLFDPGRIPLPAWILMAALWLACIIWGGYSTMAMCFYPLGIIDIAGGIAACFIVMEGSRGVEHHLPHASRFLQWVGRNTLAIFTLHIVEDNIIAWGQVGIELSSLFGGAWWTWIVLLIARFALEAAMVGIMYLIPGLRNVYFPQLAKRKAATAVASKHAAR